MRYRLLGRSGLRVSELCLGTMTFGESNQMGAPENVCRKIFDGFVEAGGNFFDTANVYNLGASEEMLARFIGSEREQYVIASKYSMCANPRDPNAGGNHKKNLVQSLDKSLKRLNTDYLDLLWVHAWDFTCPIDETMRALDDVVRSGKVLHLGISNAPAWVIATANTIADERGLTPFTAMQILYNLVQRHSEAELLPLAQAQNMAVTPWSPLGGGLLTNKFAKSASVESREGARMITTAWGDRYLDEGKRLISEKLNEIASEVGLPASTLAINWLRQSKRANIIPIIGIRSPEQLSENLTCLDTELSTEVISALNEISNIDYGYPARLINDPFIGTLVQGEMRDKIDTPKHPRHRS